MKLVTIAHLIFSCMLIGTAQTYASSANFAMQKAARFYEQGSFDSAISCYRGVIETGTENGDIYYNLGNAYFRANNIGMARLSYEKAMTFSPSDPDIKANVTFLKSRQIDAIVMAPQGFLAAILSRAHNLLPLNRELWVLLILWTLVLAFASMLLFAGRHMRLWFIYGIAILGFLILPIGISAGAKLYSSETIHEAIVLAPTVDAKNQPSGTIVLFSAHEGTKFRIRQSLDNWSLVSLENGVSGWVPDASLGKI